MVNEGGTGILRLAVAEYFRSALTPSRAALAGILVVAAVCFAVPAALVTPKLVGSLPEGALMSKSTDRYARITVRALRQATDGVEGPAVALLGASSLRESVTGPDDLTAKLERRTGRRYAVVDLMAPGLGVLEYPALVEVLGADFRGVVVMEVGPHRLGRPPSALRDLDRAPRLGFRSAAFDDEVRRAGFEPRRSTGNCFLDNLYFFVARPGLVLRPFTGPLDVPAHTYVGAPVESRTGREKRLMRYRRGIRDYGTNGAFGLEVLARTVGRLPAGARAALVETPRRPSDAAAVEAEALGDRYCEDVRRTAAEAGAEYWDLPAVVPFRDEDFHDVWHLKSEAAMERFTDALADRLAALLREER
jgi:hypothetical protein